jgi:hypothetical protein
MDGQTGGVITGGLVKLVVTIAVVAIVVFDGGAVVVNTVQLDGIAGAALRTARQTWADTLRVDATEAAVEARLEPEEDVRLEELAVTGDELVLTIARPSRTLLAHRIPQLEPYTDRSVTKRAALR